MIPDGDSLAEDVDSQNHRRKADPRKKVGEQSGQCQQVHDSNGTDVESVESVGSDRCGGS